MYEVNGYDADDMIVCFKEAKDLREALDEMSKFIQSFRSSWRQIKILDDKKNIICHACLYLNVFNKKEKYE